MCKIFSRNLAITLLLAASCPLYAQSCNPNIQETTPTSRFTVNANGTVLDKKTGLMWKQCVEGLGGAGCAVGSALNFSWGSALIRAANSKFAYYKDWRLPNSKELESLLEDKCYMPMINLAIFPNTPLAWAWSSSSVAYESGFDAWFVDFKDGYYGWKLKGYLGNVRLVRGGQ